MLGPQDNEQEHSRISRACLQTLSTGREGTGSPLVSHYCLANFM